MVKRNRNKIIAALRDFFSGKKSKEGNHVFNSWFQTFDDSNGYLEKLNHQEKKDYKNKVFQAVQEKINRKIQSEPIPIRANRKRKRKLVYKIAAVFIIGVLLSVVGVYLNSVSETEDMPVVMIEKTNPTGQISKFTLPDGSVVWLSAASSLEYPEKFPGDMRTIHLEGEAFFDVKRDSDRPFVVHSGPLYTSVLGTSFNIEAYTEDPDMVVTVATGKVEVSLNNTQQKKMLEPNQQVRYDSESGLSEVIQADAFLARAWTQKELIFMRDSFATIARTFERWYGVEFIFESEELKDEVFIYHFKELSLRNSMDVLIELADFDYRIDDQKVYIKQSE